MDRERVVPARILVVEGEPNARAAVVAALQEAGYVVDGAADGEQALARIAANRPDLVLTDVTTPGPAGLERMERLRGRAPEAAVVAMTTFGSIEAGVEATGRGADDYLSKPIERQQLLMVTRRTLARRALQREAVGLRETLVGGRRTTHLIGGSARFGALLHLARQSAATSVPILLNGERGSGKRALARLIHHWSGKPGPFVPVPCAALGAGSPVDAARGGTLYLDGVDDLSDVLQDRLSRWLERPEVDVRLISSSSRDLVAEVAAGRYREALRRRLAAVVLEVPALRERPGDVLVLSQHFLRTFVARRGERSAGFARETLELLAAHDWPGNVRQLKDCIEHAAASAHGAVIEPRDLPQGLFARVEPPAIPGATLREIEEHAIVRTLEFVGGSTGRAAKILGISPGALRGRIQRFRDAGEPEEQAAE